MKGLLVVCIIAGVWLLLPSDGEAVCCRSHRFSTNRKLGKICNDCSEGKPYCGVRSCNVLGCNCGGGCREGFCERLRKRSVDGLDSDAHDVIRAADANGDGRLSVEEARHYMAVNEGVPVDRVKRSLAELDADNDEFLSPGEIDTDIDEQI